MSLALSLYRLGFRLGALVAPEATADRLLNLFLTPLPRSAPSQWSDAVTPSARPVRFRKHALEGWAFGEGPTVLLVHGWGGAASQLEAFVGPLVAAGRRVVAFDGPAHGKSPEKSTNLLEFAELVAEVGGQEGATAVLGHSFGAAAVLYGIQLGFAPERVALVSSFSSSEKNLARFGDVLGLGEDIRGRLHTRVERFFEGHDEGWVLHNLVGRFPQPALLVHDRADKEIPYEESVDLHGAWPGSRLVSTDGLGHRRILKDPGVVAEVTGFLTA